MAFQIIHVHARAPAKPALGQPCNGCGVCCTAKPCPIGQLLSRRRTGACVALHWVEDEARYRCGLPSQPLVVLNWAPWAQGPARLVSRLARRWIAAGTGCDADCEVERR